MMRLTLGVLIGVLHVFSTWAGKLHFEHQSSVNYKITSNKDSDLRKVNDISCFLTATLLPRHQILLSHLPQLILKKPKYVTIKIPTTPKFDESIPH